MLTSSPSFVCIINHQKKKNCKGSLRSHIPRPLSPSMSGGRRLPFSGDTIMQHPPSLKQLQQTQKGAGHHQPVVVYDGVSETGKRKRDR
ncbi:hypothetical protein Hanom_Chr01g00044811 [Helianthus anomalus]